MRLLPEDDEAEQWRQHDIKAGEESGIGDRSGGETDLLQGDAEEEGDPDQREGVAVCRRHRSVRIAARLAPGEGRDDGGGDHEPDAGEDQRTEVGHRR